MMKMNSLMDADMCMRLCGKLREGLRRGICCLRPIEGDQPDIEVISIVGRT
jgi:polyphosphate kinase